MVILKLGRMEPDIFECEKVESSDPKRYNLIRPCERYKELYDTCTSIHARIHQYYVYGETIDCKPMIQNYRKCLEYRKTKDISNLDSILKWEKNLIFARNQTVKQNTTWELRETPPENFNSPLPDYLAKRQQIFKESE